MQQALQAKNFAMHFGHDPFVERDLPLTHTRGHRCAFVRAHLLQIFLGKLLVLFFQRRQMRTQVAAVDEKRVEARTSGKERAAVSAVAQWRTENQGAAHALAQ